MAVKDILARWMKASKILKKENQIYWHMVAEIARKHLSEAFYALDDPLGGGDVFGAVGVKEESAKPQEDKSSQIIESIKSYYLLIVVNNHSVDI